MAFNLGGGKETIRVCTVEAQIDVSPLLLIEEDMMEIIPKTIYPYKGKDYKSTTEIREVLENEVGAILDRVHPRLPPKQALQLLKLIIANREELVSLLTVEMDVDDNTMSRHMVNLLDL